MDKEYYYGSGLADIVSFSAVNQYYYLGNHLGSILGITDETGSLKESYQYDAYGSPFSFSSIGNPYMFAGMWYDKESDLYHTKFRNYSSKIGRFLSHDPVRSVNRYVYSQSNPINFIDPLGLWVKVPGKKDIWLAEDGDTLKKLASSISGDEKDWVCLWPVEMRNPNGYPSVKECDKFDVSNLTAKRRGIWETRIGVSGGIFTTIQDLSWGFGWYSSEDAAYGKISRDSGEGASPISYLLLAEHSAPGMISISNDNSNINLSGIGLQAWALGKGIRRNSNTYTRAIKKKGPVRCWFTRDAKAYGLACNSRGWARNMASQVLRRGATAYGTPNFLDVSILRIRIRGGSWHYTLSGLLSDPLWVPYGGSH